MGGVDLRNPLKDLGHQAIHIDWVPRERKSDPFIGVVCFIYLDDSNINNGAGAKIDINFPEYSI